MTGSDERNNGTLSEEELVRKNRISGLQPDKGIPPRREGGEWRVSRSLLVAFGIGALALIAIGVVILFFYKKPAPFLASADKKQVQAIGDIEKKIALSSENPHIARGKESYAKGFFTDAIAEFNNVVESDASEKDKAIALTYLGMIADERNEYDRAIEFYNRALRYDRKNGDILRNMALTYRHKKDYKKAIEFAQEALDLNGDDLNARILLGNIYFETARYQDAITTYGKVLEISPENPQVLFNMGSAQLRIGDEFSAIEYLKKAGSADRIGEVAHRAYSRLGVIFTERKDFEQAEKYLRMAVEIRPGDAVNHYNLGIAYLRQNKKEQALQEFATAETLGEKDAAMLENLGEAYFTLHDYNRSLNVYNQLLTTNSRNVRILSRIAEIYYEQKELDQAYSAYKQITMIEPATENARVAWLNMGNVLDDQGRYDEAIEAYQKSLSISEKDDTAYYNLGIAYKHAGKPELAIQAWKRSGELNTGNPVAPMAIANFYYEKGFYDLAEKEYQRITTIWPQLQEPHFKAATIYYKRGLYEYAQKAYQRVLQIDEQSEMARKALTNLALITVKLHDDVDSYKKSVNYIKKALLLEPGDAEALFSLGIIYAQKEEYEKSIDSFYQAIRATGENKLIADCYNNIGKSYFQQRQYKKALQAFTRGLDEDSSNEEMRMNRKTAMQAYEEQLERER